MSKMAVVAALMAGLFASVACETTGTSIYRPAQSARGTGYSEAQLAPNRFRITFVGADSSAAGTVQDLVLLRAAELTLNMGYDWFTVVARETVQQDNGRGGFSTGYGPGYCGIYGCGSGFYGGIIIEQEDDDRLAATLEIIMGKGEMPSDNQTYNARDVAATIRSRL